MAYKLRRSTIDKRSFLGRRRLPTRALDAIADGLERLHVIRIAGALALVFGVPAFAIDLIDRTEARTVAAWNLLTTQAPGNSGKRDALEYLNSEPWYWPLKRRVKLGGIDLSDERHGGPVDLTRVDLTDAYLNFANLSGTRLEGANLDGASLQRANISGARFGLASVSDRADFTNAWAWEDQPPRGLPLPLSLNIRRCKPINNPPFRGNDPPEDCFAF